MSLSSSSKGGGGSYGRIFIPTEKRVRSNILDIYYDIIDEETKEKIILPNPKLNETSQKLGRLLNAGTESKLVINTLYQKELLKKKSNNDDFSSLNNSIDYSSSKPIDDKNEKVTKVKKSKMSKKGIKTPIFSVRLTQPMDVTEAILLNNKSSEGSYYIKNSNDPYFEKMENKPSNSFYNKDTPKMWSNDTLYPSSITSLSTSVRKTKSPVLNSSQSCSIANKIESFSVNENSFSTISKTDNHDSQTNYSSLQSTLIGCGRLTIDKFKQESEDKKQIDESFDTQKQYLKKHSNWLNSKTNEKLYSWDESSTTTKTKSSTQTKKKSQKIINDNNSDNQSSFSINSNSITNNTLSSYRDANTINELLSVVSSKGKSLTDKQLLDRYRKINDIHSSSNSTTIGGISIPTNYNSQNPFRQSFKDKNINNVSYSRTIPKKVNVLNPLDYKEELLVRTVGNLNACIKPYVTIGEAPSRSEVNDTLIKLTRKTILSFNVRIVESGVILKALKDPRHLTPGLQSILDLHKQFRQTAQINANNWLLNKKQILTIMELSIGSWVSSESINRFIKSYDPQNIGLIRYIRISVTLLACLEPKMIELASTFNRVQERIYVTDDNREDVSMMGELIMIRFLHKLYSECAGNSDELNDPNIGMKIEDLPVILNNYIELFKCCVCNIDDEIKIDNDIRPLTQYLYEKGQNRFDVNLQSASNQFTTNSSIDSILKFPPIKAIKLLPPITEEDLVEALKVNKPFFRKFVRQVRSFRKLAAPYLKTKGTVSLEDSISQFSALALSV